MSLKRGPQPEHPITLTRRRIYILPTAYGLTFAFALLVILVGSVNYNNGLGYMLCFLLGGMALISILHTYRNLAGLKLHAGSTPAVFANESAGMALCLDNSDHSARYGLIIEYIVGAARKRRRPRKRTVETVIGHQENLCVELPLLARRRGWLSLKEIVVKTRYPLGLFRAWSPVRLSLKCLVYPRPEGNLPLPPVAPADIRKGRTSGLGDEDFSGFRDFSRGDSPRRVYWKAAARGQGMLVKVFSGSGQGDLILRWEESGEGYTETRLSQLCRWVLIASQRGLRFSLQLPGTNIPLGEGESHTRLCLKTLALFGNQNGE
ncbi:MAG: DUF58 domain-containing protein [Gammaproteobacteria bacterium]|nr:DUF58 domain-containing protein [Gammaproteobacteria bacterium]